MNDELRIRFEAECSVEILKVFNLRARIEAKLAAGSTFMAKAVSYYSKNDEIGIRWAFPDKIAFEKIEFLHLARQIQSRLLADRCSLISEKPPNRSRFRLLAIPNSRNRV